ncbi:abortive phage infection protein [Aquimarina aggregata]|uniref:Abortive phage infection protein n=1 Tax=Aquimarina aggregata TaxID=1642818 RepID=A0A163C0F9_9FLAO|nr:type II CAAX endopeptidase family protein [Aquimarina aggregata]KZS41946.1 abortive phage infection protein [Aquimarina aggregata]
MNTITLRTKIIPLLAIISVFFIWLLPLGFDYFETIIAAIIILIASAIEFKKGMLKSLGFQKHKFKVIPLLIYTPLIAIGLFILYYFVLIPGVSHFTGDYIDFSNFDKLRGNFIGSLSVLPFIWISAAFGEEIVWRGYFMKQFTKFFGDGKLSLTINIVLFGILFGYLHGYQGINGQIITGIIGSTLVLIFYKRSYDLWFNIAIHGFFDTIALIAIYQCWI